MPNTQDTTDRDLAGQLITFMETGTPPDGLFTEEVFCDFTMAHWQLQSQASRTWCRCARPGTPALPLRRCASP